MACDLEGGQKSKDDSSGKRLPGQGKLASTSNRFDTKRVPPEQLRLKYSAQKAAGVAAPAVGIALHIIGETSPIIIKDTGKVLLGREIFGGELKIINLARYYARLLGVSRQHAILHIHEAETTVEDLGSTNGTWLNEVRLEPKHPTSLRNGDMLRLGQMMIFVYLP